MYALSNKGFSLVEVIVVAALIGFLSTLLLINFSRTRVNLTESMNAFGGDIRDAQSRTVSSTKFAGYIPCGYGITYIDSTHYALYAGPNAATTTCSTINRNYSSGQDSIVYTKAIADSRLQFQNSFTDIFFEPPDPKTYINNNASLASSPQNIVITKIGGACPGDCQTIRIHTSGKIEIQ